jgi:subtilisin family serine protease
VAPPPDPGARGLGGGFHRIGGRDRGHLDTGIDYTHIDLAGLVDLDRSVSFVPSDDALVEFFNPGAHPVADLHWHGSHVASTVSSNAVRAAGVTSKTTLVGVKVCNVSGSCPFGGVLAGVVHAADVGADIMNLSLGGFSRHRDSPGFIATVQRAFNYASRNGTLPVVAAGNNRMDLDHTQDRYFRYCEIAATVCVSATNQAHTRAGFSNHGRSAIASISEGDLVALVSRRTS